MASTLYVQLAKPLLLPDVLRLGEATLRDLLGCDSPFRLSADLLSQGGRQEPPSLPFRPGHVFIIKCASPKGEVSLVLSATFPIQEQAGLVSLDAGVSVSSATSDFEYALAAAIAGALSTLTGSNIIDDNEFWNNQYEQASGDFLEKVRVKQNTQGIHDAVERFARQMNKR